MLQPRIVCQVGSSASTMRTVRVNEDLSPIEIENEHFKGSIVIRMASYLGPSAHEGPSEPLSDYMTKRGGGMTWSIGITGIFTDKGVNADDILFGNVWEGPIRDSLPFGTSAALKFIHVLDPSLREDIYGDKPHAEVRLSFASL